MKVELLIDSREFFDALQSDLQEAQKSIYLQTLSFEGDTAGKRIANLLLASPVSEMRIMVDHFTHFKMSDRLLWWPWNRFNPRLMKEVRETQSMFGRLKEKGAKLIISRDPRSWFHSYFATNHKKTILIDDHICYLGGINLCDHNFAWHDLMFRFEDQKITHFLKNDFLSTFAGLERAQARTFGDVSFFLMDGRNNETYFAEIFKLMHSAQKSLIIISPYLSWPFTKTLRDLDARGVQITVITPLANNYPLLRRFISSQFAGTSIQLKYYIPGMSHMKAMLIDEDLLIAGSSNFDLLSYRILKEIVVVCRNPSLIKDFQERVLKIDLKQTREAPVSSGQKLFHRLEKGLDRLCVYFNQHSR